MYPGNARLAQHSKINQYKSYLQTKITPDHIYNKKKDKIQLPSWPLTTLVIEGNFLSLIKIISGVKEGEPQELIANIVLNGETLNAFLLRCRKSLEWFIPRKIAIDGKLSKFLSILKRLFYSYTLFDLLNYIPIILEGTAISICQLMKLFSFQGPFFKPFLSRKPLFIQGFPHSLCNSLVPSIFHSMEQLALHLFLLLGWVNSS